MKTTARSQHLQSNDDFESRASRPCRRGQGRDARDTGNLRSVGAKRCFQKDKILRDILEQSRVFAETASSWGAPALKVLNVGRALPAAYVNGGGCPPYMRFHLSRVRRSRVMIQDDHGVSKQRPIVQGHLGKNQVLGIRDPRVRQGGPYIAILVLLFASLTAHAAPATQPSSTAPAIDPALWKRMTAIDERGSKITSLTADFEQKKFTALLRKPLLSSGRVRVKGATMRWDTEKPEPTVMLVGEKTVQLYFPAQKTVEEYPLDQRLAELAASPLPRLGVLKERFSFTQISARELNPKADPDKSLALKLTPIDKELAEHVQEVRVLLDIEAGYIVQAELTDADGDRTVIQFLNLKPNADVGDLELKVPPGTKFTRPLEGLGGVPPGRSK